MPREVIFGMREIKRLEVLVNLGSGGLTVAQAAARLGLSRRQIQRLKKRFRELGSAALVHGNRGRPPKHALAAGVKEKVIHLFKTRYYDHNFSHLAEVLAANDGLVVSRETLRQWLRPLGLGRQRRRRRPHRCRRPRSRRYGEMLFLDGSPHHWFGTEKSTLLLCVDDATGAPLRGWFQPQEDLHGCFLLCLEIFRRYGLPSCFYLDRASQFTTTRQGGIHSTQDDRQPTQFERAMDELGIALIFAHSPQARGRIERLNGAFQDRLVAELRYQGISTIAEANHYLNHNFIPRYRRRFAVAPADPESAWRPLPPTLELRHILCQRYERVVKNDNTVSIKGQIIQLLPLPTRPHLVRARVRINHWLDGSWHVYHDKYGFIPTTSNKTYSPKGQRRSGARAERPPSHGEALRPRPATETAPQTLAPEPNLKFLHRQQE